MRRRNFIRLVGLIGGAAAWPLVLRAQQPAKMKRIAMVHPSEKVGNMTIAGRRTFRAFFEELGALGYVEGRNLLLERYSGEGRPDHYAELARDVVNTRPDLIIAMSGTIASELIELALKNHIPAIYPFREFAEVGGLLVYSVDLGDISRRMANLVDKILKGANLGDIPFFQPTKFELIVNLKTSKALGLQIPATLVARADEVIE
jgi:ABC-type uncharacterized transport system substrate-binding protein